MIQTVAIDDITGGGDLFFCEPYKCKLLARACVERQAKVALGNSDALRMCKGCADGEKIRVRAAGVVVDVESLKQSVKRSSANRPAGLRAPKFNPATVAVANPVPATQEDHVDVDALPIDLPPAKELHVVVSPQPQLPLTSPATPEEICDHGIPMDAQCKRCQLTEPLSREMLDRAMVVYGLYRGTDNPPDAIADEWVEFFNEHGSELIALSLAALGRITPPPIERRGKYQKHKLGATQQRIVDLLGGSKRLTVTDISRELGQNYQNTRRMLPVLERRGLIRNEFDQLREATVWMRSGVGCASEVTPPSCEVGVTEGEPPCGNRADHRIRLGKSYLYSCAICAQGFADVGAFADGEDAELIPLRGS